MNAATAIDPRDYAIIRALGALSLGEPNVELARAFLRDAGAGDRIHHAAQVQRCHKALIDASQVWRMSDQAVVVMFPSCRLATVFEELATAAKEPLS
jgi:hypothetical protein